MPRPSGGLRLLLVLAVALPFAVVSAQDAQVFIARADVVAVPVLVRDPDGRPVEALSASDFELLEDGRRVPDLLFDRDSGPLAIAVMVDVSGTTIDPTHYGQTRTDLLTLVESLEEGDRVSIGTFGSSEIAVSPLLTGDRHVLTRVVSEEVWPGLGPRRPLWNALGRGAEVIANEAGLRVVVVVTDGPSTHDLRHQPNRRDALRALEASGAVVYAVARNRARLGPSVVIADTAGRDDDGGIRDLYRLSVESGGGYLGLPSGVRLSTAFNRILSELRQRYFLGFRPTHADGRTYQLEVRLPGTGLVVHHRSRYVSPLPPE